MKYLLFLLLPLFSCGVSLKPVPKKKYTIVINRIEKSLFDNSCEESKKIDSVFVENDSLAYWQGVIHFTGAKMAEKLIKENNTEPPYITKDFDVLDEDMLSIKYRISEADKLKAKNFISSHQ